MSKLCRPTTLTNQPREIMKRELQLLACAGLDGNKPVANHDFRGRDDNRYFDCELCNESQSWGEYCDARKHPDGPCRNTKSDYESYNDLLRLIQNQRSFIKSLIEDFFTENDLRGYATDRTESQLREALLRATGKWTETP